jgi:hypothetical protein
MHRQVLLPRSLDLIGNSQLMSRPKVDVDTHVVRVVNHAHIVTTTHRRVTLTTLEHVCEACTIRITWSKTLAPLHLDGVGKRALFSHGIQL